MKDESGKILERAWLHSVSPLQYLTQVVGADRVAPARSTPMATGDFDAVRKVKDSALPDTRRALILGDNAARALNL